jgi:hypothetical protein
MDNFIVTISNKNPELSKAEKQLKELISGREPKNEEEREIVKQLEKMKKAGQIPYIPSN